MSILSAEVIIKKLRNFKKRSIKYRKIANTDFVQFNNFIISNASHKAFNKLSKHFESHSPTLSYFYQKFNASLRGFKMKMGPDRYYLNIADIFDDRTIFYTFTAKKFCIEISFQHYTDNIEYSFELNDVMDKDLMFNLMIQYSVIPFSTEEIKNIQNIMKQKPEGCYTICSNENNRDWK